MSQMKEVYRGAQGPIIRMSFREAELLKLVCNVFHALKISFANEIGAVAGQLGADAERLMKTFVLDTKLNISAAYLRPGFAFGGSCLPKDLRSLMHVGKDLGLALPVTEAILPSNDAHLNRIAAAVLRRPGNTVGIAGLVFKAGTDDVRESPAVKLAGHLVAAGRSILVHEPEIQVEKLVGANLAFLREHLPEYAKQLVSWSTLNNQSDLIVFTRPGLVSPPARKQVSKPCIDIYHIGSY
jgi:GDP-mannose 6-dehydrogenase